jgi:hypothetical protein
LNKHVATPVEGVTYREPWEALPGSQARFVGARADHLLYTGTRGPGKTDAQLYRFRRWVGLGYGPYWRGVIFDREYKNLDDIISKSKRWFTQYNDGAKFLESGSHLKWVWPTGEELLFRHAAKKSDYWKYHGQEFPFIGWNELCKFGSDELYESMMSCNRSSYTPEKDGFLGNCLRDKEGRPILNEQGLQIGPRADKTIGIPDPIPLEVVSTTNPFGPGHNWVKRRFITPAPIGTKTYTATKVFDPGKQQDVIVTKSQLTMVGSYRENIYLSPSYIAELKKIKDKNKRMAWLGGSWDIVAGGALDDVWQRSIHVKPRFVVPKSWHIDRALDWGSSHPLSVGWFAEANGEEATLLDGTKFCPPKGSIIQIDELYLTEELGTNVGLKLPAGKVAKLIKEREIALMEAGWILKQPWPGPADNQIRDVRESDVDTIEKKMSDEGIRWEHSDKSPGSRKNGLQVMRDMLEAAMDGDDGQAHLYFMENCRASIDLLPTMPRDDLKPDDVDTDAEDHCYDMVRYRVLKGANRIATKIKLRIPTAG